MFFMRIGYTLIDQNEQNANMQIAVLRQFYVEKHFEDRISDGASGRPQLQSLLEFVRSGDVVYAESITRLASGSADFLALVDQLISKNAALVCLKEDLDTSSREGKHLLFIFKTLSQLDKNTAKKPCQASDDSSSAKSKPYGRPKIAITETFISAYHCWKSGEITAVEAMQLCGLKKNTFYNRVKEFEEMATVKKR